MKYEIWRALDEAGKTSTLLYIARTHVKLTLENTLYLAVEKPLKPKSSV